MNSFKVKHMVLPNDERTPFNMTNLNMPVASYYWEVGKTRNTFLRKSGYKMFPGAGVRWETEPGMVYGMSPAMDCLGDGRMLQSVRATYLKQEHKRADPPLAHPANVLHVNQLPGGSTPVKQSPGGGQAVYPLYQVTPDARGTLEITQDIRDAIREALYNDLFKMIAMAPQRQKTATEIAELHEEKLLLLGPVLERVHSEGFTPTIDRTFQIMVDQDMIAPPPEEIQGMPLKVEYKSILAQAQKMVSTGAVEQFMGYIGNYGQVLPDLLDIPNPDAIGDGLADYLGIDAKMLRTPKERQVIRDNRAQQAAAAQVAELANSAANTTKTLGDTPIEGGEQQALDALLGGIGA